MNEGANLNVNLRLTQSPGEAAQEGAKAGKAYSAGFMAHLKKMHMDKLNPAAMAQVAGAYGSGAYYKPSAYGGDYYGKQLAKVYAMGAFGMPIKGLRGVSGSDLARVQSMGQFNSSGRTIRGLRETGGADLAKVNAMGSFGAYGGKPPPIIADLKAKMNMDRAKFIKDATFAMMPLFNPTSVWGNLFATRQIFSGLAQTKTGQGLVGRLGMGTGTGATALAAGGTVGVLLAVGLAIKGLAKVMHESIQAYKDAPKLYAKAMTSGLGLKFVSKRSMLADIMGVSMEDVVRYGAAFQYLNPRIEWASTVLANTNRNLTSVGWGFKIVGYDLKAMFATMADKAAPAFREFNAGLATMIEEMTTWSEKHPKAAKAGIWAGIGAATGPAGLAYSSIAKGIFDIVSWFGKGKGGSPAPAPLSFMKQLPASSWEKMGLILGNHIGGGNPQQQTANNTKRSADTLAEIKRAITKNGGIFHLNFAQNAI